jgi:hypothetical protein
LPYSQDFSNSILRLPAHKVIGDKMFIAPCLRRTIPVLRFPIPMSL